MHKNRYAYGFFSALLLFIVLNFAVGYFIYSSKEYFVCSNKVLSRDTLNSAQDMLSSYDTGRYPEIYKELAEEYKSITEYTDAVKRLEGGRNSYIYLIDKTDEQVREIAGKYEFSEDKANEKLEQISYCMERIEYARSYPGYISKILSNADDMASVGIFGGDVHKNIAKTKSDLYGLENITVSAETDAGIGLLFSDAVSDILAVFSAVICALFYSLGCASSEKIYGRSRIGLFALVFAFGTAVMYVLNIFSVSSVISMGDMGRAVQSVVALRSCRYLMSVGAFIFIRIIFKVVSCLTVYFFCTGIFSCRKNVKAVMFPLAVATAEFMIFSGGHRINFFAQFKSENIIADYGNILFAGLVLDSDVLISVSALFLLAVSFFTAEKNISASLMAAAELSEKAYFDEINSRYTEARLIRHDIKNHLSAVAVLLDEGDIDGARKYLGEISDELDKVRPPVKTGSSVLDALLFRKFSQALEKGIKINTVFYSDFSSCRITDYDLCGIFSNILDNACEACEKLPDEDKCISLTVRDQMDMVCIFCENKYSEIEREGNTFSTLKSDKSLHGLGLKRIGRIAEKYGGSAEISAENNVFSVSVIMIK